jgi:RNA polymerase sigma-70 factor (ECF subfamily)
MARRLSLGVGQTAREQAVTERAQRESDVRGLCEQGELPRAVAMALELYGGEIVGFLAATGERDDSVAEIHSELCETLCAELARFAWRSSLRTWMYALARNARHRCRDRARRGDRLVPLSQVPEVVAQPATSLAAYKRSTMKERLAMARARLAIDERELLVLRVDRGLAWADIASILNDGKDGERSEEELARAAAALRKRFERTMEKLKRLFAELAPPQRE